MKKVRKIKKKSLRENKLQKNNSSCALKSMLYGKNEGHIYILHGHAWRQQR